jgi:hypothetical protein
VVLDRTIDLHRSASFVEWIEEAEAVRNDSGARSSHRFNHSGGKGGRMNRGGFSWNRFLGITNVKRKVSRFTGIPWTKSGRERKVGAIVIHLLSLLFK